MTVVNHQEAPGGRRIDDFAQGFETIGARLRAMCVTVEQASVALRNVSTIMQRDVDGTSGFVPDGAMRCVAQPDDGTPGGRRFL